MLPKHLQAKIDSALRLKKEFIESGALNKKEPDSNGFYHFVYCTVNLINGKIYVGKHSTKNPADSYLGSGVNLFKAIRKYGRENFKRDVIAYARNEQQLNKLERYWISNMAKSNLPNSKWWFYNLGFGGEGNLGYKHTEETKLKTKHFGSKNGMFGRKHSLETRAKIAAKAKGRKMNMSGVIAWRERGGILIANRISAEKRKIRINQFDLEGNLIKEWPSCGEVNTHYKTKSSVQYWIKRGLMRHDSTFQYA